MSHICESHIFDGADSVERLFQHAHPAGPNHRSLYLRPEIRTVRVQQAFAAEVDSLVRRENQLVTAQEQRYKTSQVQAFGIGYGQGDGVEASELANVKGEKEAVRTALAAKNCGRSW